MAENNAYDGKTISIISYLWAIGWLIALLMHNNNRTSLGAFHLRQSLGLLILGVLVWILIMLVGIIGIPILGWMLYLGLFVLWLLGFLSAFLAGGAKTDSTCWGTLSGLVKRNWVKILEIKMLLSKVASFIFTYGKKNFITTASIQASCFRK